MPPYCLLLMVPKWKPELKLDLMETFPQRSPLLRNSFLSFLWQSLGLNLEKLVQVCIRYIQAGGECPNHSSSVRLWGLCPVTRLMKVKLNFFIWWGHFLLMGRCFGLIWFRTLTEDASSVLQSTDPAKQKSLVPLLPKHELLWPPRQVTVCIKDWWANSLCCNA